MEKIKQVFSHDSAKGGTHAHDSSASRVDSTPSAATGTTGTTAATHDEHQHAGDREKMREAAHPPKHHRDQPREAGLLDERDAKAAQHDHQHLAPVTHENHQRHEIEEVERQREVDRHVHHVQHHVQPVLDTQHGEEQVHQKVHPETNIREKHVATEGDKAMLASLNTARDSHTEGPSEKTIVDKGEKVHTNTSHHVHHLVQPVIERDVHEHHKTNTVVPIHQETHEAPIVHQSVAHEPMHLKEFVSGGGDLKSNLKHDGDLLEKTTGSDCTREVSGPAEQLSSALGLGQGSKLAGDEEKEVATHGGKAT